MSETEKQKTDEGPAESDLMKLLSCRALISKLDEYLAFLDKANKGPIIIAHVHGWRCPQQDIDKSKQLRDEIEQLRLST